MNICGKKNEIKEFWGISFCRQICIKLVQGKIYFTKHLLMSKENLNVDFPGGPLVKTLCFQCRGKGFNPWSGN